MPKGRQSYEIYLNDKVLVLTESQHVDHFRSKYPKNLCFPFHNKVKVFFQYLNTLEHTKQWEAIIIHTSDLNSLMEEFYTVCKQAPAAGGIVEQIDGRVLAMFRRGYWDLPKGKLDKGEDFETAALREIQEETGIQHVELVKKIHTSFHMYRENTRWVFKKTKWYWMKCHTHTHVVPQIDEGIEILEWISAQEFKSKTPIFSIIINVLEAYESI